MTRVSWTLVTAFVVLSSVPSAAAQSGAVPTVGSLCVLPHVRRADVRMQSPEVPPAADRYEIRLDGGNWVPLSPQASVLLAGIPRPGRHKVVIKGDGRPFSTFTFRFAEFDRSDLCLSQSGLYLTWRFHPSTAAFSGCRCRGVEPAAWEATTK